MFLDATKSYYYKAFFASKHSAAHYALGLFGSKTKRTQAKYPDIARDEKQRIIVNSTDTPLSQVSTYFLFLIIFIASLKELTKHVLYSEFTFPFCYGL